MIKRLKLTAIPIGLGLAILGLVIGEDPSFATNLGKLAGGAFIVLALGGLAWVSRHELQALLTASARLPLRARLRSPIYLVESPPAPTPSQPLRAAPTNARLTPELLVGFFDGKTTIQGGAIVLDYVGQRMSVTGEVLDIARSGDGMKLDLKSDAPHRTDGSVQVSCLFDASRNERVNAHQRGETVTVEGELAAADSEGVSLEQCVFPTQ